MGFYNLKMKLITQNIFIGVNQKKLSFWMK